MKISVKVDAGGVIKSLGNTEKQVRAATMIALTKTAKHAQKAMYDEFRQQFDRPTPTVMKSLFVDPAKKDRLAARMYLKDRAFGGKNPRSMSEILAHHFVGGGRQHKQLEDVLRSYGYLDQGEMIVPGFPACKPCAHVPPSWDAQKNQARRITMLYLQRRSSTSDAKQPQRRTCSAPL